MFFVSNIIHYDYSNMQKNRFERINDTTVSYFEYMFIINIYIY